MWMIDVSYHTLSTLKSLVDNLKVIEGHSQLYGSLHLLQALCSVMAIITLCPGTS